MKVVLEMLFLVLNNANVKFIKLKKLISRSYITIEVLFTTSSIKLINKKEFAKVVLIKISRSL